MGKIYASLSNQQKEILWTENSGNAITPDQPRGPVFEAAGEFIQRFHRLSV